MHTKVLLSDKFFAALQICTKRGVRRSKWL